MSLFLVIFFRREVGVGIRGFAVVFWGGWKKACFCGGELMVSLWWRCGFLWWRDGGLCGVEKHANFLNFIFGEVW
jgi:hypothetical protein